MAELASELSFWCFYLGYFCFLVGKFDFSFWISVVEAVKVGLGGCLVFTLDFT